jgi:hypothetical protein
MIPKGSVEVARLKLGNAEVAQTIEFHGLFR